MRKFLLFLFIFMVSSAGAQTPAPDCAAAGKDWDQLVQDFVSHWQAASDFCEFKRFIALNSMIASDMRVNARQYDRRIAELNAYGDQSEAVNYLLSAFQETWFNLFIDASLDREFTETAILRKRAFAATLGILGVSLVLPHMKTFSSRTTRFLRAFIRSFFDKRPFVFGTTSLAKAGAHLSMGDKPEITTGFVRPPLLGESGEPMDKRTRGIFRNEFYEEVTAATAGVGSGWLAGHYASLGVKSVLPKWTSIFSGAAWARSKLADFASPGLLAGAAIAYKVSDLAATTASNYEFRKRVSGVKRDLTQLASQVNADVVAKNEYSIWLNGEQLKNGLMLQNYFLTRGFTQSLSDESERTIRRILTGFADCGTQREVTLKAEKAAFKKRLAGLLASERLNLDAALDITQAVQEILLAKVDDLTEPLIETSHHLLLRDRWILDLDVLTDSLWDDVTSATKDAKVECAPPDMGSFP